MNLIRPRSLITEGTIHFKGIGDYKRTVREGVAVYSPQGYGDVLKSGTTILTTGANTGPTCFWNLPHLLAQAGQEVQIIVIPGYEDVDHTSDYLLGNLGYAWGLSAYWNQVVPKVMRDLAKESLRKSPDHDLYFGGFSLGGAFSLLAYIDWKREGGKPLTGLVWGAPAFTAKTVEKKNGREKWFLRRVMAPLLAVLGGYRGIKERPKGIPPEVEYLAKAPRSSVYASLLSLEHGRQKLIRLKGEKNLPPLFLAHGGKSDQTVSERSAPLIKDTFHSANVTELCLNSGHIVFAGPDREKVQEATLEFYRRTRSA